MKYKTGQVEIVISEPWEAGVIKRIGFAGKRARYINKYYDNTVHSVLVTLDEPIAYKGSECRYLVCSPRHEGFEINDIWASRSVSFGMIGIDEFAANSEYWFDTSNWRGGPLGFLGSIRGKVPWWRKLFSTR